MLIESVVELDDCVPVSLYPVALTAAPVMGLTLTVIKVCNGRFTQFTTTATGLFCWEEITASGVAKTPVGDGETGTPPMSEILICGNCPVDGTMMGWMPALN